MKQTIKAESRVKNKNMDLSVLRHSCSHIMAQAVKELWPQAKLAIGPSIEDGFYYDFDKKEPFSEDDLAKIEKKMLEIVNKDEPFVRQELDRQEAGDLFRQMQEPYKVELINALGDNSVSLYKTGNSFLDLCRGPHVNSTGQVILCSSVSTAPVLRLSRN